MTRDQYAWKQFSTQHIQREGGTAPRDDEEDNYHEENFDVPVTSSTRATTNSKTNHRQNQFKPRKSDVQKIKQITSQAVAAVAAAALVENTDKGVKKPKTRAERREIEPTEENQTPAAAQTNKRPAKREQRSEYWVVRDDKRRTAAINFKFQNQENWRLKTWRPAQGLVEVDYQPTFFLSYSKKKCVFFDMWPLFI